MQQKLFPLAAALHFFYIFVRFKLIVYFFHIVSESL